MPAKAKPNASQDAIASSVLADIEGRVKKAGGPQLIRDMWITVDLPITTIAPVDSDTEYNFSGAVYSLIRIEDAVVREILPRLAKLEDLPITECYKLSGPLLKIPLHTRCRFVRSTSLDQDTLKGDAARMLRHWKTDLKFDAVERIWVEAAARVSEMGAPLEKIGLVRPIAIATNKGLFLVVERVNPPTHYAKQAIVQGERSFSFIDATDVGGSAARLQQIFIEELTDEFRNVPILASRDLSEGGKIIFKRWNVKSNVIGRENFIKFDWWNSVYERSTFEIQWNCADSCRNILVELNQTLFVSNDNRTYDERKWPPEEIRYYLELYRRAATESYLKAVRRTCNRLLGIGMVSGNICKIRGNIL